MKYHPRTTWQDPRFPVFGPADNWADNDTVVIHYTAGDQIPDDVAGFLRNTQYYYVTQRGYSIGYSFAVDQKGDIWQLRGWEYQSAANRGHNDHTLPILVLVDGQEPASPEAVESVRRLVQEAEYHFGREMKIVGHREIGSTSCPGAGLQTQVNNGVFKPVKESKVIPLKTPKRLYDSRAFDNLKPNQPVVLNVGGAGVPGGATGVFITLTAVPGKNAGWLRAYSGVAPATSDVNFRPHENIANTTLVALTNGSFKVESNTWTDVIVDVKGYVI